MRPFVAIPLFFVAAGIIMYGWYGLSGAQKPLPAGGDPQSPRYLLFDRPVKEGDFIDREDLKWAAVDPHSVTVPELAILQEDQDISDFDGALAVGSANKDDFARSDLILLPRQHRFLASVLPRGKRAISIEIDAVTGSSGLIQPGNKVDLILFTEMENVKNYAGQIDPKAGFMAKTILENIRVIAINRKITNQDQGGEKSRYDTYYGDDDRAFTRQGTATLEVTPKQAEIVTVAQRMGTLSLSLRSDFENDPDALATSQGDSIRSQDVVREFPAVEGNVRAIYGTKKQLETTDRMYEDDF